MILAGPDSVPDTQAHYWHLAGAQELVVEALVWLLDSCH